MNSFILKESDRLSPDSCELYWESQDRRTSHLLSILKASNGDQFKAAFLGQPTGTLTLCQKEASGVFLKFLPSLDSSPPPPLSAVTLYIGVPRPPTCERLIRDLCSLGVRRVVFFGTKLNERSYFESKIWDPSNLEWRLQEGMQQSGVSRATQIETQPKFHLAVEEIERENGSNEQNNKERAVYLLDSNGSHLSTLSGQEKKREEITFVIGPERGFSPRERERLLGCTQPLSLGDRILRTETVAVSLALFATAILVD